MRSLALVGAASVLVGALSTARPASAQPSQPIAYSYEVENPDASPDKVLVLWPRTCHATGAPLGSIDLALNPDWTSRMNDVDYEVVVKGKPHHVVEHCLEGARLYALPANEFARAARVSTADDSAIGQPEAGASFAILPALDAITLDKRVDLFRSDARVLRSSFRFEAPRPSGSLAKVNAVHDVLSVDGFGATAFSIVAKRVIYTYSDGSQETRSYVGASRPDALRARGDAEAPGASATASPGDGGAASTTANADVPPPTDRGTRWVYLAAVGGLVVGGALAYFRKKREQGK